MSTNIATTSLLAALFVAGNGATASAQDVSARIRIGDGPVSGVIWIGHGPRPVRDVIVVDRVRPRVLVVERRSGREFLRRGRGIRVVIGYYDPWGGVFYDRGGRGLYEVRLFSHRGRFYVYDDGDFDRRFRRDRFRPRDRWDDRFDRDGRRDSDDRWDDRRDRDREHHRDRRGPDR